uniref:Receptor-like protein EIX2 n=1 Tax=Elaeis guineensis var. tenera TaxID=51953 RepID=A0A8N4F2W2_ELAGV|nr:receptor-like protein EIX2 [Elaeis guineensis]
MHPIVVYPLHFNFFNLVSGLSLMASGGCNRRSLTIKRVMLIGFLLCVGAIPFCLCLGSEGISKVGGSCIENERRALLAIKADIYDPHERLTSWMGPDCCQWRGVGCDNSSGHVVKLKLRFLGPTSKVNPSISSLIHLRHLDLSMNSFSGAPIPEFIGSLMHLKYLNLSNSGFGGPIPRQIGNLSNLHSLDLGTKMYGSYALQADDLQWLSRIPSLQYLDLSSVNLSMASNWLHEINMHSSLLVLKLSNTGLPDIPSTLQHVNFTSFTMLDLSSNYFQSATIPDWLLNISSLVQLDLSSCNFHGRLSIAVDMLGNLNRLKYLDLSENQITGDSTQSLWNNEHMEFLDLSYNQITGLTAEMLGNLSQLRYLALMDNKISGEIPENLGNISHLVHLELSNNRIGGEMPKSIGNLARLQFLRLFYNNITGQIPESMSMLCSLQVLDLSYNRIGGEITSLMQGFSKCINNKLDGRSFSGLDFIAMSNNNFSGTIPKSLGQLSALTYLDLSWNSFTGYLTEVHFSNLTRLDVLDLSYNSFKMNLSDGWIPPFSADFIYMCSCRMGPKFPAWLRTQTKLNGLCLSEAGISDKIPSWLWYKDMNYLNVSHNCMEGRIPSSLRSRTYGSLDLRSNCLSGPIPNVNADLIILSNNSFSGPISLNIFENAGPRVLSLSHNHINGSIPHFLYNWTSLEVLDLSHNELSGRFPDCGICNLTSLVVLDLSDNKLFGGFPDCWSKSQRGILKVPKSNRVKDTSSIVAYPMELQSLHVRNNSLSGEFPSFLRLCKQLVILDLGENRFSGNIPTWIGESLPSLRVLRLRSNFFDGNIPTQISSLSFLQVLDLACNNFSGNLPSSFGNFTAMAELQEGRKPILSDNNMASYYYQESVLISAKGLDLDYTTVLLLVTSIDLSQNNLFGEIPNEVTNLHGLRFLNLSRNHFIGKIPQNIGDMRQLESLDLSMNDLCGQIPQTMLALNYLSKLNLSYNNLSGRIPSGYQFLTFDDPSIYIGNHNLCGQPLLDCPTREPPHQEEEEVDEDDYDMIWIYASSALGFVMGFWGFVALVMIKKNIRISYLQFIDRICDWVYTELAIKFTKLKSLIGKSSHKRS